MTRYDLLNRLAALAGRLSNWLARKAAERGPARLHVVDWDGKTPRTWTMPPGPGLYRVHNAAGVLMYGRMTVVNGFRGLELADDQRPVSALAARGWTFYGPLGSEQA